LLWEAPNVALALTSNLCTTRFNLLCEVVLNIRDQRILVGVIKLVVHAAATHIILISIVVSLNIEGELSLLRLNLLKELSELFNLNLYSRVFSLVILQMSLDALSVECMQAGEHVELLLEDALFAKITYLLRIDSDMLMSLLPLLLSEFFSAL
jgi:hypothetical protein